MFTVPRYLLLAGLCASVLAAQEASAQTGYPLVGVRNPANGHYYTLIVLPTPISWADASRAARNTSYRGLPGYLATVTSAQENNFLRNHVYKDAALLPGYSLWLGGFKLSHPEGPKHGWRWVTGEPWDYTYWSRGEPNNAGNTEDKLIADGQRSYVWNDLSDNSPGEAGHVDVLAYVVEYGKVEIAPPRKRKKN